MFLTKQSIEWVWPSYAKNQLEQKIFNPKITNYFLIRSFSRYEKKWECGWRDLGKILEKELPSVRDVVWHYIECASEIDRNPERDKGQRTGCCARIKKHKWCLREGSNTDKSPNPHWHGRPIRATHSVSKLCVKMSARADVRVCVRCEFTEWASRECMSGVCVICVWMSVDLWEWCM